MCKNKSTFFIFTFFLQILPVLFFFSRARSTPGGGRDRKISAPVSALFMSFGLQGWTALFELVDTAGPKVLYQGQY